MPDFVRGVATKVELVSKSKGAFRLPLAQSFDYTPRFTERTINEFDNLEAAAVLVSFDGVDVRFDYFDTESKVVDAAINDLDPTGVVINNPGGLKNVQILLNIKNEDGIIFESIFCRDVRVKGQASAEPVKEESRITVDGSGTNVIRIKGHALLYTRILHDTPDVSVYQQALANGNSRVDDNFPAVTPFKVTLAETAIDLPTDFGFGTKAVQVRKNGEAVTTGYTLSSTEFEVTSAPAATDVWEVVTVYVD